jgi:hypothetical protein
MRRKNEREWAWQGADDIHLAGDNLAAILTTSCAKAWTVDRLSRVASVTPSELVRMVSFQNCFLRR